MRADPRLTPPVRGRSGARTGEEVLEAASRLQASGTLVLAGVGGADLRVLRDGRETARVRLGDPPDPSTPDLAYLFHPRAYGKEPVLPPMIPGALCDAVRAWPRLGTEVPLEPKPLDVPSVLERLRAAGFDGVLGGAAGSDEAARSDGRPVGGALLVLAGGAPVAAAAERDGHRLDPGDAVRALLRQAADPAAPTVYLAPLPAPLPAILAGLILGFEAETRDGLSGSVREGDDLVLLEEGRVLARLHGDGRGHSGPGVTRAARDPARLRELELPDDPPGFEERRYRLTLRGRDVLDPMTDLSMQFEEAIGASGKRLLRTLRRGLTVAEVGHELGLGLDQLRPWLRRLEEDGLVVPTEH